MSSFDADTTAATLFLSIAVVVAVALGAGAIAHRLHQPRVVGEIIGGILLGPTLLGRVPGHPDLHLFPMSVRPFLSVTAQLGLVLFMFLVGVEADAGLLKGRQRLAAQVSLSSIALPFGLGVLAAFELHRRHGVVDGKAVSTLALALFLGAAMSITAFPVLARIIAERGLARTPLGTVVLASAAVDDVVAWAVLAGVLAIVASSGAGAVLTTLALTVLWAVVMLALVRPALAALSHRLAPDGGLSPALLTLVLGILLLSAWATSRIGIHVIIGAFVAGVVVPGSVTAPLRQELVRRIEPVTVTLLLPVFFVVTGLGVDLGAIGRRGLAELLLILAVAVVGKAGGAFAAARAGGIPSRRALAIGVLMNTRGLTELVILSVGRGIGVLDAELYALMVVMALVTTIVTGPLLTLVYPERLIAADLADDERARLGTGPRVLAVVPESPPEAAAVTFVATGICAGLDAGEVTLVRYLAAGGTSSDVGARSGLAAIGRALGELSALGARADRPGHPLTIRPSALLVTDAAVALATQAARLHPDLVVLPGGSESAVTAAGLGVDTARVTGRPQIGPVLLVLTGDAHDGLAAELAARLAAAQDEGIVVTAAGGRRAPSPRRLAQVCEGMTALGLTVLPDAGEPGAVVCGESPLAAMTTGGGIVVAVAAAETAMRLDVVERLARLAPDGVEDPLVGPAEGVAL